MLSRLRQKFFTGSENLPYDPLGVAFGNKKISNYEYECGRAYEKYYTLVYGKPHAKNVDLERIPKTPKDNPEKELRHKLILQTMDTVLTDYRADVMNACVYHNFPDDYKRLQLGLRRLIKIELPKK